MPFVFGPQVPTFNPDPEDDDQVPPRPSSLPAVFFNLPKADRAGRLVSPLAQQTREVASPLAAELLNRPVPTPAAQVATAATSTAVLGEGPMGTLAFAKNSIALGFKDLKAAMGSMFTTLSAQIAQTGAGGFQIQKNPETGRYEPVTSMMEEWAKQLRENAEQEMDDMLVEPDGKFQEYLDIVLRMAPPMALAIGTGTGALALTGDIAVAALASAGGGIFFVERAGMQRQMEDAGVDEADASFWSALAAFPVTALELVLPGRGTRKIGEFIGKTAVPKVVKRRMIEALTEVSKETAVSTLVESVTEAGQNILSELAVGAVADDFPTIPELIASTMQAAKMGAIGGATFGLGFGVVGEVGHAQRAKVSEASERTIRSEITNFDPDDANAVPPGTTIAGKRVNVDKLGRRFWIDVATGHRTTKPTRESLSEDILDEVVEAEDELALAEATGEPEIMGVTATDAATSIIQHSEVETTPEVVELNIRRQAIDFLSSGSAGRLVNQRRVSEIKALVADLEAMALDPTSDANFGTRVTAMAKMRAIEFTVRQRKRTSGRGTESLNVTTGAKDLAEIDDATFDEIAAALESGGNTLQQRVLTEARRLRSTDLFEKEKDQVNKRLKKAATRRARGATTGSKITTPDGKVGTVVGIRPSGFLEVLFEGEEDGPIPVDPAELSIIPKVKKKVKLPDDRVADVISVTDDGVKVRLPDDSTVVVNLEEIEVVGEDPATAIELTAKQEEQRIDLGTEVRTILPDPITGIDEFTGQDIEIVEIGANSVLTDDGQIIDRRDVSFSTVSSLVSDVRETQEIPTFKPGTQPSAPNRHINFLHIPESLVDIFETAVLNQQGDIGSFIDNTPGANLFLLPQPAKKGTAAYAIEIPGDARTLTDASKKVLSFLGGKDVAIHPATLRGRVRLNRTLVPEEVRVSRVPPGLVTAVAEGSAISQLGKEDQRNYLRRLTDLGFEVNKGVAEALVDAKDLAETAAHARITGDLGSAELKEIEAQVARTEASQRIIEQDSTERQEVWALAKVEIAKRMTDRDVGVVEALNESLRDDLKRLPGISGKMADRILKAREKQGGSFVSIMDLLEVDGINIRRVQELQDAIRSGKLKVEDRIAEKRLTVLKGLFARMPGRRQGTRSFRGRPSLEFTAVEQVLNPEGTPEYTPGDIGTWLPAFEHPDVPGMTLVIDKEVIPSVERVKAISLDELRAQVGDEAFAAFSEETLTELTSPTEEGERDIYHIKYITPELGEILVRTVGHVEEFIEVPAHLARSETTTTGRASAPLAVVILNEGVNSGKTAGEVVKEMRGRRKKVEKVKYQGEEATVVPSHRDAESGEVEAGIRIEFDRGDQIVIEDEAQIEPLGQQDEPMVRVSAPRRLTPDEVLDEVMGHVAEFHKKAGMLAIGEWRSPIPGKYASIREGRDGNFMVGIFSKSEVRKQRRLRLFDVEHLEESFTSYEEAEIFLRSIDFTPATGGLAVLPEAFSALPEVTQIPNQPAEPGGWDMHKVEDELSTLLRAYKGHGFIPQPLRDYAVTFAIRWNARGLSKRSGGVYKGSLFGGRDIRRVLKIKQLTDIVFDAEKVVSGKGSGARQTTQEGNVSFAGNDAYFEGGNIVVEKRTASDMANDVRVYDGILLDPTLDETDPARMETAKELMFQKEHRDRFLDLLATDGDPILVAIGDNLVYVGEERRLGIIIDSNLGTNDLVVQTFVDGQPVISTVSKEDTPRVRSPDKSMDYYRAAKDAMGELTNLPATPEIGASPHDITLGLDQVTDRDQYIEGLTKRVGEIVEFIGANKDGQMSGDAFHMSNLTIAWIRMKELGIKNVQPSRTVITTVKQRVSDKVARERRGAHELQKVKDLARIQQRLEEITALGPDMTEEQFQESEELVVERETVRLKEVDLTKPVQVKTKVPGTQLIPDVLIPLVNQQAYKEIANTFSDISAYGDIMARTKLDMLGKGKIKMIDAQAKEMGFDPSLPTWRKVELLMQNVWDPTAAHLLYQKRSDLGFLQFSKDGGMPDNGMEFRVPSMSAALHTSAAGALISFPRTIAARTPTVRLFYHLAEKARTVMGGRMKEERDIIHGLMAFGKNGVNLKERRVVAGLLRSEALADAHDRPGDILSKQQVLAHVEPKLKAQLKGFGWYRQYRTIRLRLANGLQLGIRNALVRGFNPIEIFTELNLKGEKLGADQAVDLERLLKQDNSLSKREREAVRELALTGQKVYDLDRTSNPAFAKPRAEADAFLKIIDDYQSLADVPESTKAQMKEWMIKDFDFWARFGINSYLPNVLQGRHVIFMENPNPDIADDIIVAFAPNGQRALEFAHRVAQGDVPGVPREAKLYFDVRKALVDDIDMQFIGPRFGKVWGKIANSLSGKKGLGAELMGDVVKALRVGREPAVPRNVHMMSRTGELADSFGDPYQAILYYLARTHRNNYLLDIEHAWETARSLDGPLSRAEGLDAIFPNADRGEPGNGPISWYMENLRDSFMGRPSPADKVMSRIFAVANSTLKIGPKAVKALINKMKDPDYDLFSDPTYLDGLYDEDYASRKVAEAAISFQSVLRLGGNLGAAAINATQHFMFTPTYLITRGVPLTDAMTYSVAGYKDATAYWKASTAERKIAKGKKTEDDLTPEMQELINFVRDAGTVTVPARGTAGGLGQDITGQQAPLFFSGQGPVKNAGSFISWALMTPFAGAERSVRLAATFAAKRAAEARGLDYAASVAFARDVVDNTQFQYYDQALPPFMRGPAARVVFQFTQFLANAVKFSKDLWLGSMPTWVPLARAGKIRGDLLLTGPNGETLNAGQQSRKALALFHLTGFVAGGATWGAHRPIAMAGDWLWRMMGNGDREEPLTEHLMNLYGGAEERDASMTGTAVGDPEFFKLQNFLLYGLPGLAALNLSQRLGVSGLDYDPTRLSDLVMGPTGAMYRDTYQLLYGETGFGKMNPDAKKLGLGLAFLSQAKLNYPLSMLFGALVATEITSRREGTTLTDFVRNTEAGRRWQNSMSNPLLRGLNHTYDIFWDEEPGVTRDIAFNERVYFGGLNKGFESVSSFFGFNTIRGAEERALMQWGIRDQDATAALRSNFLDMAAEAQQEFGMEQPPVEEVQKVVANALGMGITITQPAIQERIKERGLAPLGRVRQRGTLQQRRGGGSTPGGNR